MHSATEWSICGTKDQILIFEISGNFDDFSTKTTNFVNFELFFFYKNGQNCDFLGF